MASMVVELVAGASIPTYTVPQWLWGVNISYQAELPHVAIEMASREVILNCDVSKSYSHVHTRSS